MIMLLTPRRRWFKLKLQYFDLLWICCTTSCMANCTTNRSNGVCTLAIEFTLCSTDQAHSHGEEAECTSSKFVLYIFIMKVMSIFLKQKNSKKKWHKLMPQQVQNLSRPTKICDNTFKSSKRVSFYDMHINIISSNSPKCSLPMQINHLPPPRKNMGRLGAWYCIVLVSDFCFITKKN